MQRELRFQNDLTREQWNRKKKHEGCSNSSVMDHMTSNSLG